MSNPLQSLHPIGQRFAAALVLLLALAVGGCSSTCAQQADPPAPADAATPPTAGSAPNAEDASLPVVAEGEAIVRAEDGRVTVVSSRYPRLGLLGKLSRAAGLEQVRKSRRGDPAEVSVRLIDATIEEALLAILAGLDYQLEYRFDEERGETVLAAVALGEAGRPGRDDMSPRGRRRQARREGNERAERPTALQMQQAARSREEFIRTHIDASDPRIRAEGVSRMQAEGGELDKLRELIADDPSPLVRAEAADRLAGSFDSSGVAALIAALNDPDVGVVLTAIEALEFAADEEHLPKILATGITRHPAPEARAAALEMVEFLE